MFCFHEIWRGGECRSPQLVISTTSIDNQKKMVTLNRLFLRNKTILTYVIGPIVYNILKAFFIDPQF